MTHPAILARARRLAKANASKKPSAPRRKKDGPKVIIGVDGEGQDFFVCKKCKSRVTSEGGRCAQGGDHELTLSCSKCAEVEPPEDGTCPKGGRHDLTPLADGHIYTYLAAVDEYGRLVSEAYNGEGLSHEECAEMILRIPRNSLAFGFMFSYDVTKILEDMPPEERFRLMRPSARETAYCKDKECKKELPRRATYCVCGSTKVRRATKTVDWEGRSYDFFNGSLTISAAVNDRPYTSKIWDCFRFFGCAFVAALTDWSACKVKGCGGLHKKTSFGFECVKCDSILSEGDEPPVATVEQIERIDAMKQKRGSFDTEDPDAVKAYCREECHLLARMIRRLIDAHERAGIPLQQYHGAGSTATALLKKYDVGDFKGPKHSELDEGLRTAIECAFFGGRFEDSVIGAVRESCHGYDISSAYPYALTHLPCLSCGFWRFKKRITEGELRDIHAKNGLAVARFSVKHVEDEERRKIAWCPLPFRSDKGSITYGTNFSGWAWAPELLSAIRGWPDLVALSGGAWIYETRCEHQPFAFMPETYLQRLAWGKEGAGKVLKLGMNASYGKCAQSIGEDPPFQSWIWAGCTTATCRGQLLDAIASAKDRWNVLAVATDGVFATEELPIKAPPKDTGTAKSGKPLGGWEYKPVPEGIFLAKPGLYYSLTMSFVRARGIGRRELKESARLIQEAFARWDRRDMNFNVEIKSRRFYGAKHSIYGRATCSTCEKSWPGVPELRCPECGLAGTSFVTKMVETERGRIAYGTWDLRTIKIAFDPAPKRERSGLSQRGSFCRLFVRDLDGAESCPYDVGTARTSPEGEKARLGKDFELEQPDWNG